MNTTISTSEAKQDKLFYIVANVIIINPDNATCLLLKRSDTEKVYPGKWAYAGGKLEHKDVAKWVEESGATPLSGVENVMGKLAQREAKEECGLSVSEEVNIIRNKVFVRPDGIPVFMTVMATEYTGNEDVVLEEGAFTDYAWVTLEDLPNYDCIEGNEVELRTALRSYVR